MTRSMIPWIILGLSILLDVYGYSAVKHGFIHSPDRVRWVVSSIYWSLTVFVVIVMLSSILFHWRDQSTPVTRFLIGIVLGIIVSKIVLSVMLLFHDMMRGVTWLISKTMMESESSLPERRAFLEKLSLGMASLPLIAFVHGMIRTAYDYQIWKINIPIANLPDAFHGFKIVQISDIHSGSFGETAPLIEAVRMINRLKPDVFVFTGDLVNNRAIEFEPYLNIFSPIKATYGQYSTLGNHDYGDYVEWDSEESKRANLEKLIQCHGAVDWEILMNEHRIIEKDGSKLALIGIENWSAKSGFPKYGKLAKAYAGTEQADVRILLSHDPSHWNAEVTSKYKDIDLTLSGHTHGMQFGVETKWFRFSPVQWVYEQWAGLYTQGAQHLYVNRGFGFLGYPGRVGIRPEITELTLVKA